MPQRAVLHTGGGDGTVVVVVVVVVAGATLGAVSCVFAGGACSLVPQAARTAGRTRLPRAKRRRARTMAMTLLGSATATLLLLEPHFNADRRQPRAGWAVAWSERPRTASDSTMRW